MIRVAVADASAISRNLLTSVLTTGGFDVVSDSNLAPANLALIIKAAPQIVCLDIGEPSPEAWERLATLQHGLPKALFFLCSSTFDTATAKTAVEHGVHGFIVKPFNASTVISTIRRAIIKIARAHAA